MRKGVAFGIIAVLVSAMLLAAIPTASASLEELCGDVNGDGTIDMRDLTYLMLIISGKKPATELADVNRDGRINVGDITCIKLIILGEAPLPDGTLGTLTVTVNAPEMVKAGGTFDVTIDVENITDINSAQFDLSFDSGVVEVTGIADGSLDSETIPLGRWDLVDANTIRVILMIPGVEGVNGSGYLAKISFEVVGEAGDRSVLGISDGMLFNNKAEEIPAEWFNDEVVIMDIINPPTTVYPEECGIATSPTPQFQWDVGPPPPGVDLNFTVRVARLADSQTAHEAFEDPANLVFEGYTGFLSPAVSYTWNYPGGVGHHLAVGHLYVWGVKCADCESWSNIATFSRNYDPDRTTLSAPPNAGSVHLPVTLEWDFARTPHENVKYCIRICEILDGQTPEQAWENTPVHQNIVSVLHTVPAPFSYTVPSGVLIPSNGYVWGILALSYSDPNRPIACWSERWTFCVICCCTYELCSGWNMVSVPFTSIEGGNSISDIFPDAFGGVGWAYDCTADEYYAITENDHTKGYHVYLTEGGTYAIYGIPVKGWTQPICSGWNLIASVACDCHDGIDIGCLTTSPEGVIHLPVFRYNCEIRSYEIEATSLDPLYGYWLLSLSSEDATLTADCEDGLLRVREPIEPKWYGTITITTKNVSHSLVFGADAAATTGFDEGLDFPAPPMLPEVKGLPLPPDDPWECAYFVIQDKEFPVLFRNIVREEDKMEWKIEVTEPIELRAGDFSKIPSFYSLYLEYCGKTYDLRQEKVIRIAESGIVVIRAEVPALTAEQPRNVIVVGCDDYTIEGTATGVGYVDIVLIGPNGYPLSDPGLDVLNGLEITSTPVIGDAFSEDITMTEGLDLGTWKTMVFSPGRDGIYGDLGFGAGELEGIPTTWFAGMTQDQIMAILMEHTIDVAGSDDLLELLTFEVVLVPGIDVNKTVWNPMTGRWENSIVANVCDNLTFNCTIHARCCNLTNITVTDILSCSLNYTNNATVHYPNGTTAKIEPEVSHYACNNTTLKWLFPKLNKSENITVILQARVINKSGVDINVVNATGVCGNITVSDEDEARINVSVYEEACGACMYIVSDDTWDCEWNNISTNSTAPWTPQPRPPLWNAQWMWHPSSGAANKDEMVHFWKEFCVPGPASGWIRISVDDDYDLSVNRVLIDSNWDGTTTYPGEEYWVNLNAGINRIDINASDTFGMFNGSVEGVLFNLTVIHGYDINVNKTVWNGTAWVEKIHDAEINDTYRFRCEIHSICCNMTNITVTDVLSDSLEYAGNATVDGVPQEPDWSEGNEFGWNFTGPLASGDKIIIEFDARVVGYGYDCNIQKATAFCPETAILVSDEDEACINVPPCKPAIEVNKTVWNPATERWEQSRTAEVCDTVEFKLRIHNNGTCCDLTNITVTDTLPDSLKYRNLIWMGFHPIPRPADLNVSSNPGGTTTIRLLYNNTILKPCESITFRLLACVIKPGVDINVVNATGVCGNITVSDEDTASVNVSGVTDFVLDIYGNANMDDTIDEQDIIYVQQIITGEGENPITEFTDAYYDGSISVADIMQVMQIIDGMESKLWLLDAVGRTVMLERPINGIACGHVSIARAISCYGACDRIVCISNDTESVIEDICPGVSGLPVCVELMEPYTVNTSCVTASGADIFLGPTSTSDTTIDAIESAGIPVVILNLDDPATYNEYFVKLSYILGLYP